MLETIDTRHIHFKTANIDFTPFLMYHRIRRLAIFGDDLSAETCFRELSLCDVDIKFFINTSENMHIFMGKPSVPIDKLPMMKYIDMIVVPSPYSLFEIYRHLTNTINSLMKLSDVPVYSFEQMMEQSIVFEKNIQCLKNITNVDKYLVMQYSAGALPRLDPADEPLAACVPFEQLLVHRDINNIIFADTAPYYNDAYLEEITKVPVIRRDGKGFRVQQVDIIGKFLNVRGGLRVTTDAPARFDHTVHIVGPCMAFGFGCEDKHTVASFLQRLLNKNGLKYRVINHSLIDHRLTEQNFEHIIANINFADGDVLIIYSYCNYLNHQECTEEYARNRCASVGMKFISPYKKLSEECLKKRLFFSERHSSPDGNELYAELLYSRIFTQTAEKSARACLGKKPAPRPCLARAMKLQGQRRANPAPVTLPVEQRLPPIPNAWEQGMRP